MTGKHLLTTTSVVETAATAATITTAAAAVVADNEDVVSGDAGSEDQQAPAVKKQRVNSRKVISRHVLRPADLLATAQYQFTPATTDATLTVRRVIPYHYTFKTFVKRRWLGRTLIDVLDSEFRDQTHDYYVKAIEDGRIRLNDKLAATSTVIVDGYVLSHTTHRHEPPVTAQPITIVEHTDEGLLVIDKPASIPVHPTGRYQHNSVIHILAKERGLGVSESDSNKVLLYPVNRLDRLTSGLMLIGSNVDVARRFERQMSERSIRKEYVCRVFGEFPKNMPFHQKVSSSASTPAADNGSVSPSNPSDMLTIDEEGIVTCSMPIRTINHKLGLNAVDLIEGKPCVTRFKLLSYDGTTSVVRAYPLTGRTHQIRVHLQFLGHPIANDPLYAHVSNVNKTTDETTPSETQDSNEGEEDDVSIRGGTVCKECGVIVPDDYRPEQMCIWLHAIKYSGEGWSYETTEPEWANVDYKYQL